MSRGGWGAGVVDVHGRVGIWGWWGPGGGWVRGAGMVGAHGVHGVSEYRRLECPGGG